MAKRFFIVAALTALLPIAPVNAAPEKVKIGIVYEDGAIIVGSVEGTRLWGKELKI